MSPDADDPDIGLMLRFQKGDDAAFEELVNKHSRMVLNLVYRYLGDASLAEDAAQDVFVKVYRARSKYSPKAKFTTWLHRISVNHCLNEIRARRPRTAGDMDLGNMLEEPSGEIPDRQLSRLELQEAVRAAVDALPPSQRMAVILARYEDMSYGEIRDAMGISMEAVKSLLFRAKVVTWREFVPRKVCTYWLKPFKN